MDATAGLALPGPSRKPTERTNWHSRSCKEQMKSAVAEWLALKPTPSDKDPHSRGRLSRQAFADQLSIPASTFRDRLKTADPRAQPKIGKPPLLTEAQGQAIVDSACRYDELNNGKDLWQVLSAAAECFDTTRIQMKNFWNYNLRHHQQLNSSRVCVDPSDASRTAAITEMGQRAWFQTVDFVREKLAKKSTGTYTTSAGRTVTYSDVRAHFVLGSDEVIIIKHRHYYPLTLPSSITNICIRIFIIHLQ